MTTELETTTAPESKGWTIGLWVAQVLLALVFGAAGFMKLTLPYAQSGGMVPEPLLRFIGVAEFAGALGMILPSATRVKPILTPIAAIGFVIIMGLAAAFHVSRGEYGSAPVNAAIGALAAFVAWGRLKKAPIAGR